MTPPWFTTYLISPIAICAIAYHSIKLFQKHRPDFYDKHISAAIKTNTEEPESFCNYINCNQLCASNTGHMLILRMPRKYALLLTLIKAIEPRHLLTHLQDPNIPNLDYTKEFGEFGYIAPSEDQLTELKRNLGTLRRKQINPTTLKYSTENLHINAALKHIISVIDNTASKHTQNTVTPSRPELTL